MFEYEIGKKTHNIPEIIMRSLLKNIFILALFASPLLANEPYDSIRDVAYTPYFLQNGYILLNEVNAQSTTVFIDVKSDGGAASRYIAANTNGTVKVYYVNTWYDDYAFQQFISNVKQENQSGAITPIRMTSQGASMALNLISELIYIDTIHSSNLHEDILAWVDHLSANGVISGNFWERSPIELVVTKAAAELNLSLSTNGTYWFLKRS